MHAFSDHLAVQHALADGMPRLIARQETMFLATPKGEVWQVFDANATAWNGGAPRNSPDVLARIFVGAESGLPVRIYRFGIGESRAITAWGMLEQLQRALIGDDRAA
jgi:hypothetical protein